MLLTPRLSRERLSTAPLNNELLIYLKAQVTLLERHEDNMRRYLLKDPSLLHFTSLWQALAEDYAWLDNFITQKLSQYSAVERSKHPLAKLQSRISHKLPGAFLQRVFLLKQNLTAPIQHELATLATDPLCYYYATHLIPGANNADKSNQLADELDALHEKLITRLATEIRDCDKYLFLRLTSDEMVNVTDKECTNYLNITRFYNMLCLTVCQSILACDDTNTRSYLLRFWIRVTRSLYNLGDYAGANAICSGFENSAVFRLNNTSTGLDEGTQESLRQLKRLLITTRHATLEPSSAQFAIVPFLGSYRAKLTTVKESQQVGAQAPPVTDSLSSLTTHGKTVLTKTKKPHFLNAAQLRDHLLALQTQLANESSNPPSFAGNLAEEFRKLPENFLFDRYQVELQKKSLQLEPRNNALPASQLFHTKPVCRLAQLNNPALVAAMLGHHQVFAKIEPEDHDATDLQDNAASSSIAAAPRLKLKDFNNLLASTQTKQREAKFIELLNNCLLQFDVHTSHVLHIHNRQCYYRQLIENPTLRRLVERMRIQHFDKTQQPLSTTTTLREVNALLASQAEQSLIDAKLHQINIHLSTKEWGMVREAAAQQRAADHIPEIEHLLSELKLQVKKLQPGLLFANPIKAQLDDYLYLVTHSTSLEECDIRTLNTELTTVVNPRPFDARSVNPFLQRLSRLGEVQLQLANRASPLYHSNNLYYQQLCKQVSDLTKQLKTPYFTYLLQGASCLHTWISGQQGRLPPDFHASLQQLFRRHSSWLTRMSSWTYLLERTLARAQARSLQTLLIDCYERLHPLITEQFKPLMTTLLKSSLPSDPEWANRLNAWRNKDLTRSSRHEREQLMVEIEQSAPELFQLFKRLIPVAHELQSQLLLYDSIKTQLATVSHSFFNYDPSLTSLNFKEYRIAASWLISRVSPRELPPSNPGAWDVDQATKLKHFCVLIMDLCDLAPKNSGTLSAVPSPLRALGMLSRASPFRSSVMTHARALAP